MSWVKIACVFAAALRTTEIKEEARCSGEAYVSSPFPSSISAPSDDPCRSRCVPFDSLCCTVESKRVAYPSCYILGFHASRQWPRPVVAACHRIPAWAGDDGSQALAAVVGTLDALPDALPGIGDEPHMCLARRPTSQRPIERSWEYVCGRCWLRSRVVRRFCSMPLRLYSGSASETKKSSDVPRMKVPSSM